MPINWPSLVYSPNYSVFARSVTITPLASQPNAPAYTARGIFDTAALDVIAEDGSIFSDQTTILDILETDFTVLPIQLDRIQIPADGGMPAAGTFEIQDVSSNGGGETTLTLRRIVEAKP